jgi:hypothetical protein
MLFNDRHREGAKAQKFGRLCGCPVATSFLVLAVWGWKGSGQGEN